MDLSEGGGRKEAESTGVESAKKYLSEARVRTTLVERGESRLDTSGAIGQGEVTSALIHYAGAIARDRIDVSATLGVERDGGPCRDALLQGIELCGEVRSTWSAA
jgi:hypothetical protein